MLSGCEKNAIMMIDSPEPAKGRKSPAEAIYLGCLIRLPIMMTTMCAL